jgi:hypothetical protein
MVATPNVQTIIDRLRLAYPDRLRFGTYNRRHIGSNPLRPWSQHAGSEPAKAYWGNAVDIHDPADGYDSALLDEVYAFLNANREALRIRVLLWRVKNHHDHVHVDTWKKMADQPWYRPPPKGPLVTIDEDGTEHDTFEEDNMGHGHTPPAGETHGWADAAWAVWVDVSGTDDASRGWNFQREDMSWVYERVIAPLEKRVAELEAATPTTPSGIVSGDTVIVTGTIESDTP